MHTTERHKQRWSQRNARASLIFLVSFIFIRTKNQQHDVFFTWCTQGRAEAGWRPEQETSLTPPCSNLRSFLLIACNATDFFNDNWRQAEAWIMLFVGAVEVKDLAQGALRRVTQRPWIEHSTIRLRGGPSTAELRSFGRKCTVLKKVLATLLGPFGGPQWFGVRGNVFPLAPSVRANSVSNERKNRTYSFKQ